MRSVVSVFSVISVVYTYLLAVFINQGFNIFRNSLTNHASRLTPHVSRFTLFEWRKLTTESTERTEFERNRLSTKVPAGQIDYFVDSDFLFLDLLLEVLLCDTPKLCDSVLYLLLSLCSQD